MQGIVRNNPCPGLVGAGSVPVQDQHDDGGIGARKMLLPATRIAAHSQVTSLGDAGGKAAVAAVPVPGVPVGDGTGIGEHRAGVGIQQRTDVAQLAKTRAGRNHPRQRGPVGKQIQSEVGDLGAHAEEYGGAAIEAPGAQLRR